MNAPAGVNNAKAKELVDDLVSKGFERIQTRLNTDKLYGSGTVVANYANRPPLLNPSEVERIAEAFGVPIDLDLTVIVDESIERVRAGGSYQSSLRRNPNKRRDIYVMLNNK